MSQFCIQCGSPIEPGVRFCGTCGRPFDVRPQPPGVPPPMLQYRRWCRLNMRPAQPGTALSHPEPLSLSSRICQVRCDRVG